MMLRRKFKHGKIYRLLALTSYYGRTLEEISPKYLAHEISMLMEYQTKATRFYQKSLELDKKAEAIRREKSALSALGTTNCEVKKEIRLSKRISSLEFRSLELRKDASRHLREGSRTVGSLILCKDLPKIKELFRLSAGERDADEHIEAARQYRQKAWDDYHGKDILPLTERTLDPEYQKKLDGNYETGINLGKLTRSEMRGLRRDMQMIFQDPAASLDPRQTVGKSIEEILVINEDLSAEVRKERVMNLLDEVGLKREHYYVYPHTLSGGQKQRVGIARAIALNPKFVVLDECVSALDVSVQAQILQLLNELSKEKDLTYFFITHDLGVVKHFCDRIVVMYLGSVCEIAESSALFHDPLHPYTQSLLAVVPRLRVGGHSTELVLEGDVPSAIHPPKGCPFHTRCSQCMEICPGRSPIPGKFSGHVVACHL